MDQGPIPFRDPFFRRVPRTGHVHKLVFMGTPELARVILSALAEEEGWMVCLVVAQPDKPVGRGLQVQASPVKREALSRGIPLLQPERPRDPGFLSILATLEPDVIVVAAYGQILPPALLAIPRFGCINVHTSLLPRWRGAAPIAWAMLEGDAETGVTLMHMDAGLDTGAVIAEQRTPILPDDTGQSLHDRLAGLGAQLVCRVLPDWLAGRVQAVPQPVEGVTYARKLTKEDGLLVWSQAAVVLDRKIRALNPWPGAFTTMPSGTGTLELLKIWEAHPAAAAGTGPTVAVSGEVLVAHGDELVVAAGEGRDVLRIRSLQREGRRRMTTREFLAGAGLKAGMRLGV